MRLIDADALLDRIRNPYEQAEVARWVNEQPTAQPMRGKWKHRQSWNRYVCSECSFEQKSTSNYCPHCGAYMRKGDMNDQQ